MTTHLTCETAMWLERPRHSRNHRVGVVFHPMECRVGKYRVEFARELEPRAVGDLRVESALSRCRDHVCGRINAHHRRAGGRDFFRQHTVAASEVEDSLTDLRLEQVEHRLSERRNEMSVLCVALSLPVLGRRRDLGGLRIGHRLNIY